MSNVKYGIQNKTKPVLADAFIQSDFSLHSRYILSLHAFHDNQNHDLGVARGIFCCLRTLKYETFLFNLVTTFITLTTYYYFDDFLF